MSSYELLCKLLQNLTKNKNLIRATYCFNKVHRDISNKSYDCTRRFNKKGNPLRLLWKYRVSNMVFGYYAYKLL